MSAKNIGIPFSDGMLITGEFTNATNQTGLNTEIFRHGTRHAMRNGEEITIATPAPHVFPRGTTMPAFPTIVITGSSVVINNHFNNVDQTSQNRSRYTRQVQENDRNREREYRRPAERSPNPFQSDIVLDPYRPTSYLDQPERSHRNAFDRNERAHKPSVTWFVPMGASAAPTKIQPDASKFDFHNPASVITLKEPDHVPPEEYGNPGPGLGVTCVPGMQPSGEEKEPEALEDVKPKLTQQDEFYGHQVSEPDHQQPAADEPKVFIPEPEDEPYNDDPAAIPEGNNPVSAPEPEKETEAPEEPEEPDVGPSLPENEVPTPPIQPKKKVRKGLGKFFSDIFNKPTKQEPVKNQTPDKVVTMRKTTDRTVVMICAMLSASCSGQYLSQSSQQASQSGGPSGMMGDQQSASYANQGASSSPAFDQQRPSSANSPAFEQQFSPSVSAGAGSFLGGGSSAPAATHQICSCITINPTAASSVQQSGPAASAPLTDSFAPAAQQQQTFAAPQQQQQQSFAAPQQSFVAPAQQQAYAPAQSNFGASGSVPSAAPAQSHGAY
ncbi:hypothetical protein DAPPUDRAFT_316004 [Daphnia pulex]|uniref:Uncharacterized protein n=1 Tax=Daphnia pulex TaxID=6669 RepID=E9GBF1_DAPPU|nr:hypothetical protein DAPPUDRAFT_316004 [Daphnia pulex]|eukprot:EFX83167.1 hypothetical protein DAPPUDRAFT_316004 [Daphnia pulex]